MTTEKPKQLIDLLIKLKNETDKTKYQSIYIDIAKEVMSLEFEHNPIQPFQNTVYKRLIYLTVKEYIYLEQTVESISNLEWLIEFLDSTAILIR